MSYVLKPLMFRQDDFVRNKWFIAPEAGVPWEAILLPEYWAHVAMKLKPLDEIVIVPEDASFYGKVLVARCGNNTAIVRELEFVQLADVAQSADDDDYVIKWAGPIARWRVTRKSDGFVVAEGPEVETKDMAEEVVRNIRKAIAA
jgi:hypothetical protein